MIQILLVRPRGFCAGVNRAVQTLSRVCDRHPSDPVYVLHEIVHNSWVVESFRRRGVRFVESLTEVPVGSILLFSAHGVSPAIRQEARDRSLKTIDATCPLVARVHQMAIRLASEGFHLFLIGHKGHQEVVGTLGEAPDRMTLLSTVDEAQALDPDEYRKENARFSYLVQTTLSGEEFIKIVAILREKFPELTDPPGAGICFATRNRQEAVHSIAPESDLVLVVGSKNSSNSKRLAELGGKSGKRSFLIDGPDDLDRSWFSDGMTILVTAGASAPEEVLRRCVARLGDWFPTTLDERTVFEENVSFQLPKID